MGNRSLLPHLIQCDSLLEELVKKTLLVIEKKEKKSKRMKIFSFPFLSLLFQGQKKKNPKKGKTLFL